MVLKFNKGISVYTPIIGTLGFIMSPDQKSTLLVHRKARLDDDHFGKYNGLGGKMLAGEDVVSCIKREIYEEAGINCQDIILRGTINWTGFGSKDENWLGFIFRIDRFSGIPYSENEEGSLAWHPVDSLTELPMWDGDRFFLPMVFDQDHRVFHGYMPYENNKPAGWNFTRL
jgi:8-oxo-dGTP diphosphatase